MIQILAKITGSDSLFKILVGGCNNSHIDLNGLLAARTQGIPVVFVVVNNDGGGIFHSLPIRSHEPAFTRYFATPHGLDFQQAARLYELGFTRVADRTGLQEALGAALAEGRPWLVEVVADREEAHGFRAEVQTAVLGAMEGFHIDV